MLEQIFVHHRVSLVKMHRTIFNATLKGQVQNCTSQGHGQVKVKIHIGHVAHQAMRLNPRTGGGLSQLTTGGGGLISAPPPEISKTTQRSDKRKTALDRSRQALEKLFQSFFR